MPSMVVFIGMVDFQTFRVWVRNLMVGKFRKNVIRTSEGKGTFRGFFDASWQRCDVGFWYRIMLFSIYLYNALLNSCFWMFCATFSVCEKPSLRMIVIVKTIRKYHSTFSLYCPIRALYQLFILSSNFESFFIIL